MVDIIKRLCKEKGTSVAAIEKQCGLGNGSIRKWDNAAPSLDRAVAVANALGVSVSYLTGESEQKEKPTPEGELSEAKRKLLEVVDDLTDEQCMKLLGIILEAKKIL